MLNGQICRQLSPGDRRLLAWPNGEGIHGFRARLTGGWGAIACK
jgi:hypothetical protein